MTKLHKLIAVLILAASVLQVSAQITRPPVQATRPPVRPATPAVRPGTIRAVQAPVILQISLTDQDQADVALYVRPDAPDAATLIRKDYLDRINAAATIKRLQDIVAKVPTLTKPDQDAIDALRKQQEVDAAALKKQQEADLAAAIQAALDKGK